jgi:hypothetical protein
LLRTQGFSSAALTASRLRDLFLCEMSICA